MTSPFHRPSFDPDGRIVARRDLVLGERVYKPGQEMSSADREQITVREIATWWQQGLIDTPPRQQQGKQQPARR